MKTILFFTFLICSNLFAMDITDIQRMAVERSSALSAYEMEARALNSETGLRGRWVNPQIMGQFGSLKSGQIRGSTSEVSFTQPIPLSDKFSLRKEIAQVATRNQEVQNKFFKNWVSHQAVLSAWRVYIAHELLNHGKERAKRLGLVKKYLETRPRASIKQRVELSLIASILVQLEKMQDQKQQDLNIALSDFEFWTGKKTDYSELPVRIPDQYQYFSHFEIDTTQDPDLAKAQNQTKLAVLDSELAVKERRPDLFVGGGYRIENVSPVNHFSYGIVGLNIPIWDTGSYRLEAAHAREQRDHKNLEDAERKSVLKQRNQIDMVKYSIEQLKRFPKKFVQQNEATIHEAEKGFRQGVLDVNTFLQAETQCHEVIDQVFLAWMTYLDNLSSLQLMRGESLAWESK